MNALEFIERCKGKTEDELRKTIIQNVWHIEDVEAEFYDLEHNGRYTPLVPFSKMTEDEKLGILEECVNDCRDLSMGEIRDVIQGELMKWDEGKERELKGEEADNGEG